jgi:hypothetical protein
VRRAAILALAVRSGNFVLVRSNAQPVTADRPDPRSFLPFGKMGSAIPTTAKRAKRFIEALNRIRWDANKSKNPGVSMDLRNTGPKAAERSIVEARGISETGSGQSKRKMNSCIVVSATNRGIPQGTAAGERRPSL